MVLCTIIAIIMLAVYGIAMTILNYNQDKYVDILIENYADLNLDLINVMTKRDELAKKVEAQKDTIADLSKQINKATVKTVPDENPSETKSEKPKKETKAKTTRKTTTRKTNTKKKEGKE